MSSLDVVLAYIYWGLSIVLFLIELFAFVEALRGQSVLYDLHGKLSKPAWLGLTAVAMILGFFGVLGARSPIGLFGVIAIVVAGVFLADVRPVVCKSSGRRGSHGPW